MQERPQSRLKSLLFTTLKLCLTIAAFWLLLNHRITDETRLVVRSPSGETRVLAVGETLGLVQGQAVVASSRRLRLDGTEVEVHSGQVLTLADGTSVEVLPEQKTTTWRAIRAYLPRIQAHVFWPFVLVAAAIKALGIVASMVRWHVLLVGQGIRFPFGHLAGTFLVGRFLGTFLPSTIGLDGYTLYDAARYSRRTVEVAAAKLIEKLLGVVGILLTFLLTLPLGYAVLAHHFGPNAPRVAALTAAASLAVVTGFFFFLLHPGWVDPLLRRLPRHTKVGHLVLRLREAAGAYQHCRGLLVAAAVLSFLVHFCTAVMYYFTAKSIGARGASVWEITFASSIQIFATVISPLTIAGEGVREIVTYVLLGGMMGAEATILFSALGFWAAEALTLVGGVVWLARRRGYAPRYVHVRGEPGSPAPSHPASPPTPPGQRVREGLLGGLYGGALLGLAEALVIVSITQQEELWVLPYAFLAYGVVGALGGVVLGALVEPLAHLGDRGRSAGTTFAFAFSTVFAGGAAVVGRFRLIRDVFRERPPAGLALPLAVAVAAVVVGLIWFGLVKGAVTRRPFSSLRSAWSGLGTFAGLAAVLSLAAWWGEPERVVTPVDPVAQARAAGKPNVLLVVVDTMRPDRLSCYGYPRPTTPHLDSLAAEGILFTTVVAQASWTKPSIATILTGLYPSTHQAISKVSVLPEEVTTLAEVLRDHGYHTVGLADNINIAGMFGFAQGFCEYRYYPPAYFFFASESASKLTLYDLARLVRERFLSRRKHVDHYYRDAAFMTREAREWMERTRARPFFLFLHYMDPHDPYFPHPYNGRGYARVSMPNPPLELAPVMSAVYDGEISYWDEHFGSLIRWMRSTGLLDSTIVVVTADHGEEFAEHGGWWHGATLYDEGILVPLVIRLPGAQGAGSVVRGQVRLLDLAPTLLDRCGISPPQSFQGQPLRWEDPSFAGVEHVFAEEDFEGNLLSALRSPRWKLIRANPGNPRGLQPLELYHLETDPHERHNVAHAHPDTARGLHRILDDVAHEALKVALKAQTHQLDAATKNRLRALGYME